MGVRRGEGPKGGAPQISRFFPSSAANFVLSSLSGGLLVELWSRFMAMARPKWARLGFSGVMLVHSFEPRPQFLEKTPREKNERKLRREKGQQKAIILVHQRRAGPAEGGPAEKKMENVKKLREPGQHHTTKRHVQVGPRAQLHHQTQPRT